MQRPSLYRDIHKGLRSLLFDLVHKSGRLDFTDALSLEMFRAELKKGVEFLQLHAASENEFVTPLLERCAPKLAKDMNADHEEQEAQLDSLIEALALIDPRSEDAPVKGHEFVVFLSRVAGEFMTHMADEEERLMPAMWKALDDSVILDTHHRIVAQKTAQEMAVAMQWMLPSMTAPDRVALLAGVRAAAPVEAFAFLRGIARAVLSPEDDAELERGLRAAEKKVA